MKNTDEDVAKNQDFTRGTNVTADNNYVNLTQLSREIADMKGQHIFFFSVDIFSVD